MALRKAPGATLSSFELVEGPTLAERIAQGPIPLDETMAIAGQTIDALEAAHEAGVIHRDLKPGNIKVRPDGAVKGARLRTGEAWRRPGELGERARHDVVVADERPSINARTSGRSAACSTKCSPAGQRFLMIKIQTQDELDAQINVVLNWTEEVKQKVPVD